MAKESLYCEATDITLYVNDIVAISNYPNVKFIVKKGWHNIGTARINGWYFMSVKDKAIISADQIDLKNVFKDLGAGKSLPNDDSEKYKTEDKPAPPKLDTPSEVETIPDEAWNPNLKDMDTPIRYNYILIPDTDIRLYDGDVVKISNRPNTKWVVHHGWFLYDGFQRYDWYLVAIGNNEILPVSVIDLSLCTLVTVKTQKSGEYDGRTVDYIRPFTAADAEVLKRTFITVDSIEQRDNLDTQKLINGKMVRVNGIDDQPQYYAWNADTQSWDFLTIFGIPEIVGTTRQPLILSHLDAGLYRVRGTYKISPTYETITFATIDHLVFVAEDHDKINIKVITDSTITDYQVDDEDNVVFVNEYATYKYVADHYATIVYVDNKIAVLEAQISELVTNFKDRVLEVMNESLDNISDQYINNLFS